jgi:enoyl-CoA hydratase/carnithine racemase
MTESEYSTLAVSLRGGVATVTLDNPPVNLFDVTLIGELGQAGQSLAEHADVRVVVLESANPEFFIAHADVATIQGLPPPGQAGGELLAAFHQVVDRFRTMPKATIAKIEGRCRGGGSELALACDMRFAAIGRAVLSQPEVGLGIIPGGGGSTRLPRLVGRARALEIILGCADFDAGLAERYGYVNRALPADEIGAFVDQLAHRIASFPAEAIAMAKEVVAQGDTGLEETLAVEREVFVRSAHTDAARRRMAAAMSLGLQTEAVETAGFAQFWQSLQER